MHANTIEEHENHTREARDLIHTWRGTDPMQSEEHVREALEKLDMTPGEISALLPYVIDACLTAGLLVGGEEVSRLGLEVARSGACWRMDH